MCWRKGIGIPADARCAACRPRLTAAPGPRVEQRAIVARTFQKSQSKAEAARWALSSLFNFLRPGFGPVSVLLELAYVKLLKVTWWRTVVSGLVKSAGPVAAVFAVVPSPSLAGLGGMLAWLMLWEVGGQNIPADWNDIEEDRAIGARTIPLVFGLRVAGWLVLGLLGLVVAGSLLLARLSPLMLGWPFQLAVLLAGVVLLVVPAVRLAVTRDGRAAARLFDRSSLYPLALLLIVTAFVLLP
jgi:4-hydroxybenzoate polyprenyltransferase